jgi:ribonuclease D
MARTSSETSRRSTKAAEPAQLLTSAEEFDRLCDRLEAAGVVGFDTEFVSESTYRPKLCLLQFSTHDEAVAVDPFDVPDLGRWWDLMTGGKITVVVHGGREEIRFCVHGCGRTPRNLVDVQIAEGLLSRGFPLGYSQLVGRVLDRRVDGKHTRTDWTRRPLSPQQIHYAVDDVQHLPAVWDRQRQLLGEQGRLSWAEAEFERFSRQVGEEPVRGDWRRLNGSGRLSRREMAVLRALYEWRDRDAESRNRPLRQVLRDDLLVEIAKIHPRTPRELEHVRGMERRDYRRCTDAILAAVQSALDLPESELPEKSESHRSYPDTEALGKLLAIALANRCADLSISTSLVGTAADLQDLIRWHVFEKHRGPRPRLMQGWREEVCGDLLADLMDGKISLRVTDPTSDHPLQFERVEGRRSKVEG